MNGYDFLQFQKQIPNYYQVQLPEQEEEIAKRSFLDRIFSPLQNESITSAIYNATDNDPNTTIWGGVKAGVHKMNPFADDVSDSHTFGEILSDNLKWQPDSIVGKVAKTATSFAGDVLLDPTSYVDGALSAAGKVIKGSGVGFGAKEAGETIVKGSSDKVAKVSEKLNNFNKGVNVNEKVGNVSMLKFEDAKKIVENEYTSLKKVDSYKLKFQEEYANNSFLGDIEKASDIVARAQMEEDIIKDAKKLQESVNNKVFKIITQDQIKNEDGISIGLRNIPFASRVSANDKKLDSFQKQLVSSEKLRKLGDDTIAPYYNELMKKIRTSKTGKKFSKFANIEEVADRDGVQAAGALFHLNNMVKHTDYDVVNRNAKVYSNTEKASNYFNTLDEDTLMNLRIAWQDGTLKDAFELKKLKSDIELKTFNSRGTKEEVEQISNLKKKLNEAESWFEKNATMELNPANLYSAQGFYHIDKTVGERVERFNKIKDMTSDEQFSEIYKMLSDSYDEAARDLLRKNKISEATYNKYAKGNYMPHVLTKEADDFVKKYVNKDYETKGYSDTLGFNKNSNKKRKVGDLDEFNKQAMDGNLIDKESGEIFTGGKYFEDDIAKMYLANQVAHNKLIHGLDTVDYLKSNILKTFTEDIGGAPESMYKLADNEKVVVVTKDLLSKINKELGTMFKKAHIDLSANDYAKYRQEFIRKLGLDPDMLSTNNALTELTPEVARALEESLVHIPVYKANDNIIKETNKLSYAQMESMKSDTYKVFDKFTQTYKKYKTIYNPGFYVQNQFGNFVNSWLGNIATLENPSVQKKAFDILRTKDPKAKLKVSGKELTYENIAKIAEDSGVLERTFAQELIDGNSIFKSEGLNNIHSGIKKFEKKAIDFSGAEESQARLSLFINELNTKVKDGDSLRYKTIEEATDSVNKFLFDYSDNTEFENEVMKRIIPFYTWLKKNSKLQLEQMFEKSTRYAQLDKLFESADEGFSNNDKDNYEDDGSIGLGGGISITPGTPTTQLDKINSVRKVFNQSNPAIKLPYQFITGKSAYSGKKTDPVIESIKTLSPQFISDIISAEGKYDEDEVAKLRYLLGKSLGSSINQN